MNIKKILLVTTSIIVIAGLSYWFLFKPKEPEFIFQEVKKGEIAQQVSETGTIKLSDKVGLGFEISGRIKNIYVEVGDDVSEGKILADLDTSQLKLELEAEKTNLELAKAKKRDAQISLESAEQNLQDERAKGEESLKNVYGEAINVLDSSYAELYKSFILSSDLYRSYFNKNDQEGKKVLDAKMMTEESVEKSKEAIEMAEKNFERLKIDNALQIAKKSLENTRDALALIREMTESVSYRGVVSFSDKNSLDSQKLKIIQSLKSVIDSQQSISSAKVNLEASINSARSKVLSLKNQLSEDGIYSAQIKQAESKIKLLEDKIKKAVLTAPDNGQVVDIGKKEGEVVQPAEPVVYILPSGKFQVEVDIYEEDIVRVKPGQPVEIVLTALPEKVFQGKVVSIDPSEKIIDGIVYYNVKISFLNPPKVVRPGMTADISIITNSKNNVLLVPKEAVEAMDGKQAVQILNNEGLVVKKEVNLGLEGDDFYEVLSGLNEGDKVVVGKKK